MALNFKKKTTVGVAITPSMGLEVAQVDINSGTLLKYGCRQLSYDVKRAEVSDMDIFKETLEGLLNELEIPKGAEIALSLPSAYFGVSDYPASLNDEQLEMAVEDQLADVAVFREAEPNVAIAELPNSTLQFKKVVYTAVQKTMLLEMLMQIKELGYSIVGVDTSVNATVNSLFYTRSVDAQPDLPWVMLVVEDNSFSLIAMQGSCYVDYYEEKISIGEVLGDAENYSTVASAVNPLLLNLPSQRLHVVSKTNVISAKVLAEKLSYGAQIVHQDVNCFARGSLLRVSPALDEEEAKTMSLDVLGAAIYREILAYSNAKLNLFNKGLGDIFLVDQPPVLPLGSKKIVLSNAKLISWATWILLPLAIIVGAFYYWVSTESAVVDKKIAELDKEITRINKFIKDNENVSSNEFDEADEIRIGLSHNKNVHSYYLIVGSEIPKKLWLTSLKLGEHTVIEGQADNLESVYSFFRNIKDYNPKSGVKLQSLGLASKSNLASLTVSEEFDTDSILTSMNADYYQFQISDIEPSAKESKTTKSKKTTTKKTSKKKAPSKSIK